MKRFDRIRESSASRSRDALDNFVRGYRAAGGDSGLKGSRPPPSPISPARVSSGTDLISGRRGADALTSGLVTTTDGSGAETQRAEAYGGHRRAGQYTASLERRLRVC